MKLRDLARAVGATAVDAPDGAPASLGATDPTDRTNPEVTAITHNSTWVSPGAVYVAIRGANTDGHRFVPDAAARGAVAVLGEGMPDGAVSPVPYATVSSARAALADAAAVLAGHPSRSLQVVGVTGTDGKTTTSWLTRHLLRSADLRTGLLSTVGYELGDGALRPFPAHFTTPEAPEVQRILGEMVAGGDQAVVLEASSHALAMDRVRAVDWDIAIWTHLSREHLDFHGTVENYFADKARLVQRAPFAVLNADDPWTAQLLGMAAERWTYSAEGSDADWVAHDVTEHTDGLAFVVDSPLGHLDAVLPMIGRFNVANALAAMAAAARLGANADQLLTGLRTFPGVPGRMEVVPGRPGADPRVIVDFAHTPPSLEKALATVRATTGRDLWVVIGSAGGPRDPSKRAPLGEVSARLADHVVFTEEDHRDTPLSEILAEMERGARQAPSPAGSITSIGDRREAIAYAVSHARPEDTVVLAGKGPEDTLERDNETIPWDEVAEAEAALRARP